MDADVVEAHLVETERAPSRAQVALASVWRDGDGVLQVTTRQVVADCTVHVMLRERPESHTRQVPI